MVKKLASHVREYKKYAIMTPILVLGEVVLEILIPLFMAELIDSGIDAGSMPEIIRYGLIILLAAIASLAFGVGAGKLPQWLRRASPKTSGGICTIMYRNFLFQI